MAKSDTAAGLFPAPAAQEKSGPAECLGMTFASDEERREHFLQRLKERLPELRQRPDFPTGNDEEMKQRFERYLETLLKGKEPDKARIVWE